MEGRGGGVEEGVCDVVGGGAIWRDWEVVLRNGDPVWTEEEVVRFGGEGKEERNREEGFSCI